MHQGIFDLNDKTVTGVEVPSVASTGRMGDS